MRSTAEIKEIEAMGETPEAEAPITRSAESGRAGGVSLSLVQAAVCILIIVALVAIKLTEPSAYSRIREWYKNEMSRTIELPDISAKTATSEASLPAASTAPQ